MYTPARIQPGQKQIQVLIPSLQHLEEILIQESKITQTQMCTLTILRAGKKFLLHYAAKNIW